MSIRTVQSAAMAPRHTVNNSIQLSNPWVRNPSWLALPVVGNTEQKLVGLYGVWPEANFIALTAEGAYTVNWGDGVTENVASGDTAQHEYNFADVDLANTNAPVTFQDSGDTVTRTAHGYTNGMTISFSSITTTTGIVAGQIYYVISATANTFKVSATPGGTALALTTNGTGIILPYKQAIVTVTPQAGQDLTSINLNVRHTQSGSNIYSSGWLDILISGPNLTTLSIASISQQVIPRNLEQFQLISSNNINSFSAMFNNCSQLQSLPILNTSGSFQMGAMFTGCVSLETLPLFDTSTVASMSSMFSGCTSLIILPLFNTQSVTTMSSMFINCNSLKTLPLFNTAAVNDMSYMFYECFSLETVPLFDTSSVTNMTGMFFECRSLQTVPLFNLNTTSAAVSGMFNGCRSLATVPLFNTQAVTNMSNMFNNCASLNSVPLFNTAAVEDMSNMFSGCINLNTVPLFNTVSVASMSQMFLNCPNLKSIPLFNTSSVTNMSFMFFICDSLASIPALNVSSVPSFSLIFTACPSLSRIEAKDFNYSFDVTSCKLSATALNEIYTNLPTVSDQTIGVSGNYGVTGDDPTIATAKGWTVTG